MLNANGEIIGRKRVYKYPEMTNNIYHTSPDILEVVLRYKSKGIVTGSNVGLFGYLLNNEYQVLSDKHFIYFANRLAEDKSGNTIIRLYDEQIFNANKMLSNSLKDEEIMKMVVDTRYIPASINTISIVVAAIQSDNDSYVGFKDIGNIITEIRVGNENNEPVTADNTLALYKLSIDNPYANAVVVLVLRKHELNNIWIISYPSLELEGNLKDICERYGLVVS